MAKYRCKICGEIFEAADGATSPVCPVCGVDGDNLELIEEAAPAGSSKYAGTQTEKNLQTAFAGESQARNKYTYFASVAKKEGYEQIAALFLKTADKHILGSHHRIKMYAAVLLLAVGIGNSLNGATLQTDNFHIGINVLNGL